MNDDPVQDLVDYFESAIEAELRVAARYDGEEYEVLHRSDAVRAAYTPEEFDATLKNAILKALDDLRPGARHRR